jgi:hypothetical protein
MGRFFVNRDTNPTQTIQSFTGLGGFLCGVGMFLCYIFYMKLKFDREVRKSIADELKKISNFGGVGLGFMGYSSNSPVILLGAFIWWIVCQTISHLLMSIQDEEGE